MACRAVLDVVIGPEAVQVRHHTLAGYGVSGEACFPLAVPVQGATLPGVVLSDLRDEAVIRLDQFHEVIGAVPIDLCAADGAMRLFRHTVDRAPVSPWDGAHWQPIAQAGAEEIVELLNYQPPDVLAACLPMILARAAARVAASTGSVADIRTDLSNDSVVVVDREVSHAGFFLTKTYRLQHPKFDGTLGAPVMREVFVATDAAIVLPYDPERDRVLLVEQFRMGPYGRGDGKPWMLEPVAGRIDGGETPEQTAYRECVEEAGLALKGLEHISSHYCSPGGSTEYFHCYLGLCDLPEEVQGQGGLDTEHEDIRTHVLPFERAYDLIASGEADNGPLIMSLIWLSKERDRLRAAA